MLITICDICEKEVGNSNESISVSTSWAFKRFSICLSCSMPVIKFLRKNKLLDKKDLVSLLGS